MKGIDNMRINKFISSSGYSSRREADKLIEEGVVTLNGVTAVLGDVVEDGDIVIVNGDKIEHTNEIVYIALNKPRGITSTTDKKDKTNLVDFIGHKERIFHIGRLDKDSEGLILMTNDGDIVNDILRSEYEHEKEYIVRVDKFITDNFINQMSQGVMIKDKMTKECFVEKMSEYYFRIILTEGMNRQIRKMCDQFNYRVFSLKRIRVMNISLDLPVGKWRNLTTEEITELKSRLKQNKTSI